MKKLEDEFRFEMVDIYKKAKREVNYNALTLAHMITSIGAIQTAKQLISKNNISEGFEILWEANRLDLTVESLVIKAEYSVLFTEEEVKTCKDRLSKVGYIFSGSNSSNIEKYKKNSFDAHRVFEKEKRNKSIENSTKNNEGTNVKTENSIKCSFINEFRKLKESAKEAVEGIEEFSKFKEYMHVPREVEKELIDKLKGIKKSNKQKVLFLVCGSVGDGKSHIISQINHKYGHLLDGYNKYNDATESDDPSKTYKEKLDELFTPFTDININNQSNDKIIVAINLGTLSNFIEDSEYKDKYSILHNFVEKNKIIEDQIVEDYSNELIDYVNFSDYSIYELVDGFAESEFIFSLFNKIVNDDSKNVFNKEYKKCNNCSNNKYCPLKVNYEFLQQKIVRESLIDIVIEAIVKYKIIVSVRGLLDFFYNLLVPQEFERVIEQGEFDQLEKSFCGNETYWKMLLPNIIFENEDRNSLFNGLSLLDPLKERAESIDEFIVEMNILTQKKDNLLNKFNYEEFDLLNNCMDRYLDDFNSNTTPFVLKTYIRFARLVKDSIIPVNKKYNDYIKYLYNCNRGDYENLQELYKTVASSIYKWNGNNVQTNWINIDSRSISKDYSVSQELKIEPSINFESKTNDNTTIYKIENEIRIAFRNKNISASDVEILIDYDLYDLMVKINYGYRLNNRDRENYIAFIDSLEKLLDKGEKRDVVKITHKISSNVERYELKRNYFGGYVFEKSK